MALDRWIALVILGLALAYGYGAFFTMDQLLPPFMQRNPIWPSTFPKVLSILSILCALVIIFGIESPGDTPRDANPSVIVYRKLKDFKLGQAALLLALMVAYALVLRPIGFIAATVLFLVIGSAILGERKWHVMVPTSVIAAGIVWYLVQGVLGIFLRPLPAFMGV
ncbi:MAG: tripartite tricarboxylate transporter TctB family protein [Pseudomonadota bacterium]